MVDLFLRGVKQLEKKPTIKHQVITGNIDS